MAFIYLNGVSDLKPDAAYIHTIDPRKIESIESDPFGHTYVRMDSRNVFQVKETALQVIQKMEHARQDG